MRLLDIAVVLAGGARLRRRKWPAWRYIFVDPKSSSTRVMVVAGAEPQPPERWEPLLRDLLADDWEYVP